MRRVLSLCLLCASSVQAELYQTLETDAAIEARFFTETALYPEQEDQNLSVTLSPEWYLAWGQQSVTVTPFGRWDDTDSERSHGDLRELHWQGVFGDWEIRAGISRVFWGKTEALHLVDTINQDDALENLDGEDKLGQPMLRINRILSSSSLQLYLLPYFRERQFPGPEGRLRPPLPVDEDEALYQSGAEEHHLDWALRYSGWIGALDYGLAWFSGTQRDPKLVAGDFDVTVEPGPVTLLAPLIPGGLLIPGSTLDPAFTVTLNSLYPFYGLMDQASLDAQFTAGGWLLKLEALWREEDNRLGAERNPAITAIDRYSAATSGVEYTLYGIAQSDKDIGLLLEYLWEEQGQERGSLFQNDVFVAARLTANDIAGTALLAGVVFDLDNHSQFYNLEFSRRLNNSSKLSLEARAFHRVADTDASFPIRQDDYLQLTYNLYF